MLSTTPPIMLSTITKPRLIPDVLSALVVVSPTIIEEKNYKQKKTKKKTVHKSYYHIAMNNQSIYSGRFKWVLMISWNLHFVGMPI